MAEADTLNAPRFVGQSIGRKENKRFLTGKGRYVDDISVPGMLHAAILRSPLAKAKILSIDTAAAKDLPGVYGVFTAAEINPLFGKFPSIFDATSFGGIDQAFASEEVNYVGDPVAIVVAEDRYIAEDAMELIEVDYDPLDPVVTIDDAKRMPPAITGRTTNVSFETSVSLPGAKEAFASAAHVVTGRIAQGRVSPTPMETRGIIVDPRMDGQLEITMSAQNPHMVKKYVAEILGRAENHVRVISPDVGGAFGQKYNFYRDYIVTLGAAIKLNRPVKWIEDRTEALQAGGHGRTERLEMGIAFDADGKMLAGRLGYEDNVGADPAMAGGTGGLMMLIFTGAYDIPTVEADLHAYFSNTCGLVPYRGPWAGETLIREITVDKAARQLGMDPLELRRKNLIREWPRKLPLGPVVEQVTPAESLEMAVEMIDYPTFRVMQEKARAEGRYIGIATSVYIEPTAISSGGNSSDMASVRLEASGKVTAVITGHSQGHSIETTMAQIVADEMGVNPDDVSVVFGDTNMIGFGAGAGGSRQAVVAGGASKNAAIELRTKVLGIASHFLQTPADQLKLESGKVVSMTGAGASMTLAEIGDHVYLKTAGLPEGAKADLEASNRYAAPMFTFGNAAHACTVEVDVETGLVKILRYVVAEDCGVMLNPAVVEGQVAGGVIQGLGNMFWEEQHYDAAGNPSAGTFKDYGMPLANDAPMIEFAHLCTPSNTPTGAKGVGEGGAIIGPPTVYNAIMDALAPFGEVELEQLPLTPARIVAALKKARG